MPVLVTGRAVIGSPNGWREDGARWWRGAAHFARKLFTAAGVELARGDLRDEGVLARLCEGKQVIFHLAAWLPRSTGGAPKRRRSTSTSPGLSPRPPRAQGRSAWWR